MYSAIVRKYTTYTTDAVAPLQTQGITLDEAAQLAQFETAVKRDKVLQDYIDRVAAINENAQKRRMTNSSIVLEQLDRAMVKKQDALARLDGIQEKLAKKILMDNQKLALSVEKEKSYSKSRSVRDFIAFSRMRISVPFNSQTQIDEELYNAYFGWLTQFPTEDAYNMAQTNVLFLHNMGPAQYSRLLVTLNNRR